MEDKRYHLQMLQAIITRMASNSFLIKGWNITIVCALFALSANSYNEDYILIAFFPSAIFWLLDGYYLWQERLYRLLYNEVIGSQTTDYSMDIAKFILKTSLLQAIFSQTLLLFYGAVLVITVLAFQYAH